MVLVLKVSQERQSPLLHRTNKFCRVELDSATNSNLLGRGEKGREKLKHGNQCMYISPNTFGFRVLISLFPFSPLPSKGLVGIF
jgi:hypothetical protein